MDLVQLLVIFTVAAFLGYQLISKVPSQLHPPLMSGSDAISGITIVGAILALKLGQGELERWIALVALILATINVVGGYVVTDRMLEMFKKKGGKKG